MKSIETFQFLNVTLHNISYLEILNSIQLAIKNQNQLSICYVNVNSINISYSTEELKNLFCRFDIVHPDGVGVFLGLKILFGKKSLSNRMSGSDFYEYLINYGIEHNYNFFFFGDRDVILNQIHLCFPKLKIVGTQNGYEYDNQSLLNKIITNNVDILIVGLGTPKQEKWIAENKSKIKAKVIIAVGDGIKVFSGTKKRGPKLIQKLGLEWFVRFLYEPKRLFKRYFFGIPLFIFRVIKFKFFYSKNG